MTTDPLFEIRDLTWIPPDGAEPLFEGVDFAIPRGVKLGLTGRSGSGKSTLFRCLVGLEPRESGEIRWRGERVTGEDFRQFRRDVVYVHQEPVAVAPTIGENLGFARRMAGDGDRAGLSREDQREWLDRLGVGDIDWSRDFTALSVGERQRVALVRCLTLQPTALLLDEPTASLDRASIGEVEQLLDDFLANAPEERSVVWVSHDAEQLQRVTDRVVEIEDLAGGL